MKSIDSCHCPIVCIDVAVKVRLESVKSVICLHVARAEPGMHSVK